MAMKQTLCSIPALIAVLALAAACSRESYRPEEMDDGWEVSTPEREGVDGDALDIAFAEANRLDNIYSLLVVKNGRLVAEKYFNGRESSLPASTASVTKSFTSALAGIALREGLLAGLDQEIFPFFPEIDWAGTDPRKKGITVGQVLEMRSGYPWEEADGYLTALFSRSDWIPLLAEFPLVADPGTRWGYSNFMSHMLAVILSRAASRSLFSFAQEFLFDPLGIRCAHWPMDARGYYYGSGDMQFTSRDLARFGQLYLDGGRYGGRQIVPQEWVEASLQIRSPTTYGREIMSSIRELGYGYFWWSGLSGSHRFNYAWGHGGQMVAVVSDLELVVVATAAPQPGFDSAAWQKEKGVLEVVGRLIASL